MNLEIGVLGLVVDIGNFMEHVMQKRRVTSNVLTGLFPLHT